MLKNTICWPKGYVPNIHKIRRPPPRRTKEEIDKEILKKKYEIDMPKLNPMSLDKVIMDLPKVCNTRNAIATYKKAGWKATFMKYKVASINAERKKDLELRENLQNEIDSLKTIK